mmetsp:Transcript_39175/g.37556  ORF Transcript_39175/g.37556 Transcript_39175/m.37556 type:complete len:90 (-) Transcript_39175:61-330(-)
MEPGLLVLSVEIVVLDVLDEIDRDLLQDRLDDLAVVIEEGLDDENGLTRVDLVCIHLSGLIRQLVLLLFLLELLRLLGELVEHALQGWD